MRDRPSHDGGKFVTRMVGGGKLYGHYWYMWETWSWCHFWHFLGQQVQRSYSQC